MSKPKEINIDGIDYVLTPKDEYYAETASTEEQVNPYKRVPNSIHYYIDCGGNVDSDRDTNTQSDDEFYDFGNYFNNEKFAEKKSKEWQLRNLLERFSYENGGDKIDWNDTDQKKHYFYADTSTNKIVNDWAFTSRRIETAYFISEDILDKAIKDYGYLINEVYGL